VVSPARKRARGLDIAVISGFALQLPADARSLAQKVRLSLSDLGEDKMPFRISQPAFFKRTECPIFRGRWKKIGSLRRA
jgi:hypothetical protein